MKKIAIAVCVIFAIAAGSAWGTTITIGFHGSIGQYEDRISVDIFPLTFVGELTYDDIDYTVTDIELTHMYINGQPLYGGWIGPGYAASNLTTVNDEIVGIRAGFGWNDDFYTDPTMPPIDSIVNGYPSHFDLLLHPPGLEFVAYRDPPEGLYENYNKRYLDDYDIYAAQGTEYGGIRYTVDGRIATISDMSDQFHAPQPGTVSGWGTYEFDVAPVPEATTLILFGSGLAALAGFRRKISTSHHKKKDFG